MKLLSLNIWGGKQFDILIDYIQKHSHDVDVFCFQEVFNTPTAHTTVDTYYRANIFSELQSILPDYQGYHAPVQWGYGFESPADFDICWGLALFVRKSLQVIDVWDTYLYLHLNAKKDWDNSSIWRNLQYVKIHDGTSDYTIGHLHGYRNGKGKTDTPERMAQSKKARKYEAEIFSSPNIQQEHIHSILTIFEENSHKIDLSLYSLSFGDKKQLPPLH